MTPEEHLASKLETIRESIIGFKYATTALEHRADKIESELADCRSKISELSNSEIRVGAQLSSMNKSMGDMSADVRAVRNSVLSSIFAAMIIWLIGTVASTFLVSNNRLPNSSSVAK